jgi:hypothetical protein
MDELVELLARLDGFERLEALLRHLSGEQSWRLCVPRACGWSGMEIEQLLKRHGVRLWDRGFTKEHLTFRVKRRQANWAEYLLWRRGIPVCSRPFNPLNQEYGLRHAPGSEPPARRRTNRPSWLDRLLSLFL